MYIRLGKILETKTRLILNGRERFEITLQIIKQQNTLICRIFIGQINYWSMTWADRNEMSSSKKKHAVHSRAHQPIKTQQWQRLFIRTTAPHGLQQFGFSAEQTIFKQRSLWQQSFARNGLYWDRTGDNLFERLLNLTTMST